jgi:molybdenum cofactor synthesis domain-containing protein
MIRAAVLTISDSAARGEREDLSGPAVRRRLREAGMEVCSTEVLPDDSPVIATKLRELAGSGALEAIFTTGGTGVAPRDVTPEATRLVLEKEIPGLGELMRMEGLKKTPLAPLSRSLAGTRGNTLIVNLPGSPRGAVESLDAILGLVPHIVALLHGETGHPPELKRSQKG